jgi:DNA-binding beta-propeller fold protein YncE
MKQQNQKRFRPVLAALAAIAMTGCTPIGGNSPSNNISLILSPTTNELYVFNLLNHRVVNTLETGARPDDLAVSSDSRRTLVTNINDGSISVFERLTGTELISRGRVNVQGSQPQGVAFNSIGNRAYVSVGDTGVIAILDTTTPSRLPTLIRSVRIPYSNAANARRPSPGQITVSPDNNRLFVVDKANGTLLAFNQTQADNFTLAEFFQPAATARVDFRDVIVDRNNRVYLADSANDQLLVFNGANIQQPVAQVTLRDQVTPVVTPENIAISKALNRLYITGSAANAITVINNPSQLTGNVPLQQVGQNIPIGGSASRPATSPVGIDVTSTDQQIYVSNGGGGYNISLLEVSGAGQVIPQRNFGTASSAANAPPLGRMKIVFFDTLTGQAVRTRSEDGSETPAVVETPASTEPVSAPTQALSSVRFFNYP